MSSQEITKKAMALPLPERVTLAQALWESINSGLAETDESSAVKKAIQRNREISAGTATVRSHEVVMRAARRAIGCE